MTRIPILLSLLSAGLGLSACIQEPAMPPGSGSDPAAAAMPLQQRLADTRLDLTAEDGAGEQMVMRLNADGTSATSMSGLVLTARWEVEGNRLCQTDIRLGGMPSDDTRPQCVTVAITGDQVTLVGERDDGGPRRFTGTIMPL